MVEGGIDLTEGSFDGVGIADRTSRRIGDERAQWAEETDPKLDEEDSDSESQWSEPIPTSATKAFDEPLSAQFGQVVPELAKSVVLIGESMAREQSGVHLARSPVRHEVAGVEEDLQ